MLGTINAVVLVGFLSLSYAAFTVQGQDLSTAQVLWSLGAFPAALAAGITMVWRRTHPTAIFTTNAILAFPFLLGPFGTLTALNWLIARAPRNHAILGASTAIIVTALGVWQEARLPDAHAMWTTTDAVTGTTSRLPLTAHIIVATLAYALAVGIGLIRRYAHSANQARTQAHQVATATHEFLTTATTQLANVQHTVAQQGEEAKELRTQLSRQQEREQIAREMHDTVAHQLSLVSLQASVLEMSSKDPTVPDSARAMRETVHRALDDMRGLITSLRDSSDGGYTGVNPTAHDISTLIDDAKERGANITEHLALDHSDSLPPPVAKAMFRIVQEGITNAIRYSDGSPIDVRIIAAPVIGVHISITNEISQAAQHRLAVTSSHTGIPGMRERADSVGGKLDSRNIGGAWFLTATLPWPSKDNA